MAKARARLDALAKPLSSLGMLEDMIARLAGIYGTDDVPQLNGCALVFCADNGVVAEGVTQTDATVTAMMARKLAEGRGSVTAMARSVGAAAMVIDVGMLHDVSHPALIDRRVARGTGNIALEPAMSRGQAEQAIRVGIDMVGEAARRGHNIIFTGEMGIGNTTTSSALASVLLGMPVDEVTGRGAGLSNEGLIRKRDVIARAIALHRPVADDPLDALSKLGGFDIAAMCGCFLGGLQCRVPVVIDGVISGIAALLAARMQPESREVMFASHQTREPAGRRILSELGLSAVIHADMALGEGTGAVMLLPLLSMGLAVYRQNTTMADLSMAQYERFTQ